MSLRVPGFAGVMFAVLFTAALLILDDPGHDDSEEILNEFYGKSGNRFRVLVGSYFLAGSGLAFLAFVVSVLSRLPAVRTELRLFALCGATLFAGLLAAAAAAHVPTYALTIDAFDEPESELTRAMIPHLAYGFVVFGLLAAGLSVACLCRLGLEGRHIPSWLGYTGYVTAGLVLFGVFFMPAAALPLWTLAAGVTLLLRPLPVPAGTSSVLP